MEVSAERRFMQKHQRYAYILLTAGLNILRAETYTETRFNKALNSRTNSYVSSVLSASLYRLPGIEIHGINSAE